MWGLHSLKPLSFGFLTLVLIEGLRERNILPETCRSRVSPILPGTLPFDDNHPTNGIGDIFTIPFHRVSMHMPGGTSLLRESTSFLLRAPCRSATSAAAASRWFSRRARGISSFPATPVPRDTPDSGGPSPAVFRPPPFDIIVSQKETALYALSLLMSMALTTALRERAFWGAFLSFLEQRLRAQAGHYSRICCRVLVPVTTLRRRLPLNMTQVLIKAP